MPGNVDRDNPHPVLSIRYNQCMPRTPLTRRKPSLTVASRLLLDRAGNPIIDQAGNRVAVNKAPKPLKTR